MFALRVEIILKDKFSKRYKEVVVSHARRVKMYHIGDSLFAFHSRLSMKLSSEKSRTRAIHVNAFEREIGKKCRANANDS